MKRTSQLLEILLAGVVAFAVAACGQGGGAPGGQGGQQEIDIAVTNYPVVLHSLPYQVGEEKGIFKEEGVNIKRIVSSSGGGTTVRNVLAGGLAFGDVAGPAAIQSYLAGAPVTIVSGTVPSVADSYYVTTNDSPIEKPEDLIGKRLAYSNPGSNTQIGLLLSLKELGIEPTSVNPVAAGGLSEGLTLLSEGDVDAAPLLEPIYSDQKRDWKTIYHFSDYVPKAQATALIANPQVVEQNPELVRSFIRAYQKSADWIYQNPEEAGRIFAKNAEVAEEAGISAVNAGVKAKFWDTTIYPEAINNTVEGMRLAQILEEGERIDWEGLLNQDFLPKDKRADISALDRNK
jgi:NitT/TauT family transport system substrate-binding protein